MAWSAQRIVYGERYVDQRPAAGRSQRRRQQLRDWPELPDRRIFQHGRLIVEKEWYGEGIVISSEAREQQHRDRQDIVRRSRGFDWGAAEAIGCFSMIAIRSNGPAEQDRDR